MSYKKYREGPFIIQDLMQLYTFLFKKSPFYSGSCVHSAQDKTLVTFI